MSCIFWFFSVKSVPQRYIIAGMIFLAIVGLLMMRSCMSMTLTQMVEPSISVEHQDSSACPMPNVEKHVNSTVLSLVVSLDLKRSLQLYRSLKIRTFLKRNLDFRSGFTKIRLVTAIARCNFIFVLPRLRGSAYTRWYIIGTYWRKTCDSGSTFIISPFVDINTVDCAQVWCRWINCASNRIGLCTSWVLPCRCHDAVSLGTEKRTWAHRIVSILWHSGKASATKELEMFYCAKVWHRKIFITVWSYCWKLYGWYLNARI